MLLHCIKATGVMQQCLWACAECMCRGVAASPLECTGFQVRTFAPCMLHPWVLSTHLWVQQNLWACAEELQPALLLPGKNFCPTHVAPLGAQNPPLSGIPLGAAAPLSMCRVHLQRNCSQPSCFRVRTYARCMLHPWVLTTHLSMGSHWVLSVEMQLHRPALSGRHCWSVEACATH